MKDGAAAEAPAAAAAEVSTAAGAAADAPLSSQEVPDGCLTHDRSMTKSRLADHCPPHRGHTLGVAGALGSRATASTTIVPGEMWKAGIPALEGGLGVPLARTEAMKNSVVAITGVLITTKQIPMAVATEAGVTKSPLACSEIEMNQTAAARPGSRNPDTATAEVMSAEVAEAEAEA